MELEFKLKYDLKDHQNTAVHCSGYGDFLVMPDNETTLLMTSAYGLKSRASLANPDAYDLPFEKENDVSNLDAPVYLSINSLGGFGAVGAVRSDSETDGSYYHKLLIYEYAYDIGKHLEGGKIRRTISNPIATFDLSLVNSKKRGRYLVSERKYQSLKLEPGAKISFSFSLGDSSKVKLGEFYIDRTNFDIKSTAVSVSGRNIIGKALKDQTFDEDWSRSYRSLSEHVKSILTELGGILERKTLVETETTQGGFDFKPDTNLLAGLQEIFKTTGDWRVEENGGKVVVGSKTYAGFSKKRQFTFKRGTDVFSRKVSRDDGQTYRRVCVRDKDLTYAIYKDVAAYEGWHVKARRTLYVEMPTGLSSQRAENYANNLAFLLGKSGKVETFEGKFTPHLEAGDTAIIQGSNYYDTLGIVTDVTHNFGKNGFTTTFTVDSGGTLTQGRISDYINAIKTQVAATYSEKAPTE